MTEYLDTITYKDTIPYIPNIKCGKVIKVYDGDTISGKDGVDGEHSRVVTKILSATLTITLLQGSSSNDALSALFLADVLGNVPYPIFLKDGSGRSVGACEAGYITKLADTPDGKEVQDRVWTIKCPRWDAFVGGNN